MKNFLSGNEAIARGAWEAGVEVAAAYPGTPSTEILETLATYPAEDVHAQWSTNEKVAMEVGAGAAKGLHVIAKPADSGALGHYRYSGVTGTLAAALAAVRVSLPLTLATSSLSRLS